MITLRLAHQRGHREHGWLDTYHTFSFGDYYDPKHMGFHGLRVMNEDWIAGGQGFGMHGHRDMEILTYVLKGALGHKDSLGNGETLRAGEFQCMTAGTGIRHSEFNPSQTEPVHLYQIWIEPDRQGLAPSYDQKTFSEVQRQGRLQVVASSTGREGSLTIHQNAEVLLASLAKGDRIPHELKPGRHAWLQVLRGAVTVNNNPLTAGDGAAVSDELSLILHASEPSEVMLFDLP